MNAILENEYVVYDQLEENIHRIELKDGSRAAVDAYMEIAEEVISTATDAQLDLIRFMIIISCDQMPSLQYLSSTAKKVIARYPNRPNFRNVYVFRHSFMANLLQMFIRMVIRRSSDKMNFYPLDKIDEAMAWLLADV